MVAATMIGVMSIAAGCSANDTVVELPTATSSAAASNAVNQPVLQNGFVAEQDPIGALRAGIYALLRAPIDDSVAITGYRQKVAADGSTAKTTVFAFEAATGAWLPQPDTQLVWSPSQAKWVDAGLDQVLSAGPAGSRGWPTVKGVTEAATSFDTLSYRELAGLPLVDGLQDGFAPGRALPESLQGAVFSPGARAYLVTTTTVDPTYAIRMFADPNTRAQARQVVYACGQPSAGCTTPASSIAMADHEGGQFTNPSGTATLELGGDGHAVLRPVNSETPFATYTYRVIDTDGPRRIVFAAANPNDAKQFGRATGIGVDNFAFFEYDGQVTVGVAQSANKTASLFAGYDRIAVDDLLTHWTPPMPTVLP
ncbi:hypothetical protein BH09ACT7_BH09ACT7_47470 [soil metagenome]